VNLAKRYIVVEGSIGAGKTSLARLLADGMNAELMLDNSAMNPFLKTFYDRPDLYGFQTQIFFLLSRYRQQKESLQQPLFKSCTISDYLFDRDRIFAGVNLSLEELKLYEAVSSLLDPHPARPDLVVYLQASVSTLRKRIHQRNRAMEKKMDRKYLEDLCDAFNHFFFHFTECPLLVVNTDQIDFVHHEGDLQQLIEKIRNHRAGREYFAPLSVS